MRIHRPEDQIYDFITNQPVKNNPVEQVLRAVARSLVDKYGLDHTQLQRDQAIAYEIFDEYGRTRKVRRELNIAVYLEASARTIQTK